MGKFENVNVLSWDSSKIASLKMLQTGTLESYSRTVRVLELLEANIENLDSSYSKI
jgi:hypothetical protein